MDDKHRSDELVGLVDQWYSQARRVDGRSALMGGALGLLLSSRHGRGVLGKVLKYGVVAGVGALAWQARNDREHTALRSEGVARPLPSDGEPVAGKPVAGKPVAGKPVAGKPAEAFTAQRDDAEPPQVP